MDGLDTSKDGGGFSAAPPPVDGLGNYKGVMLCNRPVEEAPARMRGTDAGNPPFKSTISPSEREPYGLTPCTKFQPRTGVKNRGPSAALRRHMQWIKELEGQVKEEKGRVDEDSQTRDERQRRMQDFFKKQRDAIKELKRSTNVQDIDPSELETLVKYGAKTAEGASRKKAGATKKPKWAMTEEETEQAEDEEAADLIRFAENLDFDKYCADSEFRHCLQSLHDRANRIQKEQDAFKDALVRDFNAEADADGDEFGSMYSGPQDGIDGTSLIGDGVPGSEARRRILEREGQDDRPDWDASTACGEDRQAPDMRVKSAVDTILENAPHLKAVHSKESMQRIIEKTMENTAADA